MHTVCCSLIKEHRLSQVMFVILMLLYSVVKCNTAHSLFSLALIISSVKQHFHLLKVFFKVCRWPSSVIIRRSSSLRTRTHPISYAAVKLTLRWVNPGFRLRQRHSASPPSLTSSLLSSSWLWGDCDWSVHSSLWPITELLDGPGRDWWICNWHVLLMATQREDSL